MKFNVKLSLFVIAIVIIGAQCDTDKPREKRTIHLFLQQFIDAFGTKPQPKAAKVTEPTGFKFNFFIRPLAKLSQPPTDEPKEFKPIPIPSSRPIQNGPSRVSLPYIPVIPMMPVVQMTPAPLPVMPPTMPPTMPPMTTLPPTMPPMTTMPPTMPPMTTMPPTMPPTTTMAPTKMPSTPMSAPVPNMSAMNPEMEAITIQPMIQSKMFMLGMTSTDATQTMAPLMQGMAQPQQMSFQLNSNSGFGANFNNVGQQPNQLQYDSDYPQYWSNNFYQPENYDSYPYYSSTEDSNDYNNNFGDAYKTNSYLPPYEQQTVYQQPIPQVPQYKAPRVANAQRKEPSSGSSHSSVKMPGSDFNYFTYHQDTDYSALDQQPNIQFYGKRSVY